VITIVDGFPLHADGQASYMLWPFFFRTLTPRRGVGKAVDFLAVTRIMGKSVLIIVSTVEFLRPTFILI